MNRASIKLLHNMSFHDSVIEKRPLFSNGTLSFVIKLCNFKQYWFEDGNAETRLGLLAFEGVEELVLDPPEALAAWPEDGDAEILRLDIDDLGKLVLVCHVSDYVARSTETCVVSFRSQAASWSWRDTGEQSENLEQTPDARMRLLEE